MNDIIVFIVSALQITFLNIILSGDNVGVIALAIRNLSEKQAKIASMVGVSGALILRIFFTLIVAKLMMMEWLHIRLLGGVLLLKITWDLVCINEEENVDIKDSKGFWKAVYSIILADLSMSLDNVIAIAGMAKGNMYLIIFGIITSIPIIFLGAKYVAKLMNKYKITIFIGGSILIFTAVSMIIEDPLITSKFYSENIFHSIIPTIAAMTMFAYGVWTIRKEIGNSFYLQGKNENKSL